MALTAGEIMVRNLHYGELVEHHDGPEPSDGGDVLLTLTSIGTDAKVQLIFPPKQARTLGRVLLAAAWRGLAEQRRERRALRKLANEHRRKGDICDLPENS